MKSVRLDGGRKVLRDWENVGTENLDPCEVKGQVFWGDYKRDPKGNSREFWESGIF